MESERVLYWATLGVMALATATGLITEHGWGDRLAERSITLAAQASEVASNSAGMAGATLRNDEGDRAISPLVIVRVQNDVQDDIQDQVQNRLACTMWARASRWCRDYHESGLNTCPTTEHDGRGRPSSIVNMQARALARVPRNIVWSHERVVEVPQVTEQSADTF